jgi:hypothetical protein
MERVARLIAVNHEPQKPPQLLGSLSTPSLRGGLDTTPTSTATLALTTCARDVGVCSVFL